MKKKKIALIIFAVLLLSVIGVGLPILIYRNQHEIETIYYTDDYPEIYEEELGIIFGEDYVLGEKKTIIIEGEDCSCGYHSDTLVYEQWEITYKDQNGQSFTQIIDNRKSLESQQLLWLEEQLEQYYKRKYLVGYFERGTFQELEVKRNGKTYCSVYLGDAPIIRDSETLEEADRANRVCNIYEEQLLNSIKDKENMIHLWELDYEEIFNNFPVCVVIHLSLNEGELSKTDKRGSEKAVNNMILDMIEDLKQDTDYTCNLYIEMTCMQKTKRLYDGKKCWKYSILQGEEIEVGSGFDNYGWQFFYANEGVFW